MNSCQTLGIGVSVVGTTLTSIYATENIFDKYPVEQSVKTMVLQPLTFIGQEFMCKKEK